MHFISNHVPANMQHLLNKIDSTDLMCMIVRVVCFIHS